MTTLLDFVVNHRTEIIVVIAILTFVLWNPIKKKLSKTGVDKMIDQSISENINQEIEFIKQEKKQWMDYEKKLDDYYRDNKKKIDLEKSKLYLRYSLCGELRRNKRERC